MFGAAARGVPKVARRAHAVPQVINLGSDSDEPEPVVVKPPWPQELCKRWATRSEGVAAVKLDSTINGKQVQCQKNLSGSTRCVLKCATTLIKVRAVCQSVNQSIHPPSINSLSSIANSKS
jgi:hypothetical protein